MGAATVQAQIGTGSSVSYANAEGGATWNREDSLSGNTTPSPIPLAAGTDYSYIKSFVLAVTVTGTTAMTNRTIKYSGGVTGLTISFKDVAQASYAQAASGNKPADNVGTNGATPSTYTAMTTSAQQWDNTSHATSGSGANGDLVVCVLGIDFTYAGGPGNANSAPTLTLSYDEA